MQRVFVRFMEEIEDAKKTFRNYLTFRLMAWITKSLIQGNHWVPLGCRGLLGSVKSYMLVISKNIIKLVEKMWSLNLQTCTYLRRRNFSIFKKTAILRGKIFMSE